MVNKKATSQNTSAFVPFVSAINLTSILPVRAMVRAVVVVVRAPRGMAPPRGSCRVPTALLLQITHSVYPLQFSFEDVIAEGSDYMSETRRVLRIVLHVGK